MANGLITRADDFGSAAAADQAILAGIQRGVLLRNVSCMAVGATVAQDAAALAQAAGKVDIGLHFTLNSEWDTVKWTPCAPREKIPTLLDKTGEFYQTTDALIEAQPDLEQILLELNAQLERLTRLGLPVRYVDAHMAPDEAIPGLREAMADWAQSKGILYVRDYYRFPPAGMPAFAPTEAQYQVNVDTWLDSFVAGEQYVYFLHPAKLSDETMAFSYAGVEPGAVAWQRELEARSVLAPVWEHRTAEREITLLRYTQAKPPHGEEERGTL